MNQHYRHCLASSGDGCGAIPIPATGGAVCMSTAISAVSSHYRGGKGAQPGGRNCKTVIQRWNTAVSS